LIKGPFCFVFASKNDAAPKYAVRLQSMQAQLKSPASPVVVLQTKLGDIEYEFAFNDTKAAKQFKAAIDAESESAKVAVVRKRFIIKIQFNICRNHCHGKAIRSTQRTYLKPRNC
jgi:hypothetical protein